MSGAEVRDKLEQLSGEYRALDGEYKNLLAKHDEGAPLADAMNQSADMVVILDRTGKIRSCNRITQRTINGPSAGNMNGKHFSLLIAPEYRKVVLDSLDEAQENGHTTVRYSLVTFDGRVTVEASLSALRDDADAFSGYIVVQRPRDNNERRARPGR